MNLEKSVKADILLGASLIILILLSRLTSHIWNFTVVGGVALLAGAYFSNKYLAVVMLFLGLILSDLVLGFHQQMFSVYFSYAVIVGLGVLVNQNAARIKVFSFSLLGACLFFLITNFAVWYSGLMYPQNWEGLTNCFTMAIPFFRAQMTSDLISALVLFEIAARIKLPNTLAETVRLKF